MPENNRVKISSVVSNQLPDYVRGNFPLAGEFLEQYYTAIENQGSTLDILQNIDKYVKTIPGEKAQKLAKKLAYIPNYMPHMFLGDFRVWINKSNNPYKEPVKVMPVNSTCQRNQL